jgi:hypothetical protein
MDILRILLPFALSTLSDDDFECVRNARNWNIDCVRIDLESLKLDMEPLKVSDHVLVVRFIRSAPNLKQLGVSPQALYFILAHISIAS